MNIKDSDLIARSLNSENARRAERSDAAAGFVVVLIVGILSALAVVHFLTPCAKGIC